ncbi:hypothetical protein [Acidithiobacillus caldus]|uniref:Uncharacterized protein n=2 Tax=Acidithiobacillus caldus TaxID=33059 RepID=F9ZR52_ACICS|nr:hypothetical protein [Acidithiobacillus caldus]AEK58788.1 hypothetical protein Atc_2140 [Acidithiobacillus caldus SM-1]OFC36600.1 hypothetical protein BAE27_05905 [Acidithiobacillus caldus]OFC38214.1 hypothetical protein BAE29_09160 [Acidithiobacillus caldus]OFC39328.1 hypothetical protein BAE28_03925 [Acidithiobacillus caldus]OFC45738.1 hypothetical protein BAE30_13810 [Acidithiobacillus caldus]
MITVRVEMDMLAVATMTYPDEAKDEILELVDGRDRDKIIRKLRCDRSTATAMVILDAKDDDGNVVMGRTLVDPNYADAGSFLEAAMMACSPNDLYTALRRLCMEESFIGIGLKRLLCKLLFRKLVL